MINTKLLRQIIEQIEANPKLWKQTSWHSTLSCGTSHCVAGWAEFISGDQIKCESFWDSEFHMKRGMELLGLDRMQAAYLFGGSRSLSQIKKFLLEHEELQGTTGKAEVEVKTEETWRDRPSMI